MCLSLIVLLIAVSHADALQAVSRLDRRCGFLHRQPVVDGLVALVVQCAVQDALQPEVPEGLLLIWEGWTRVKGRREEKRQRTSEACSEREEVAGVRTKAGRLRLKDESFYVSDWQTEGFLPSVRSHYKSSSRCFQVKLSVH